MTLLRHQSKCLCSSSPFMNSSPKYVSLIKEKKLLSLVKNIQNLRSYFDILIISHSIIDKKIIKLVDHFYYDSNNDLSDDFDLRYVSWFGNDEFFIESSLVYNKTTSIAIARANRYSLNFANFWGYKKIHYICYI